MDRTRRDKENPATSSAGGRGNTHGWGTMPTSRLSTIFSIPRKCLLFFPWGLLQLQVVLYGGRIAGACTKERAVSRCNFADQDFHRFLGVIALVHVDQRDDAENSRSRKYNSKRQDANPVTRWNVL